jgi:hypothetical protein
VKSEMVVKPMNEIQKSNENITDQDRNQSALKALSVLLPGGVGEAMYQFRYGKGEEARQRRLHDTVEEVAERLRALDKKSEITDNEDFGTFFTKAADPISRSTNEDKRQRFRDLLLNSMLIPQGDPGWEESMYCLDLLQNIDPTGLYVLAFTDGADRENFKACIWTHQSSYNWLYVPKVNPNRSGIDSDCKKEEVLYNKVLVEASVKELQEMKIIQMSNGSITPHLSHGYFGVSFIELTEAGRLLSKWTKDPF